MVPPVSRWPAAGRAARRPVAVVVMVSSASGATDPLGGVCSPSVSWSSRGSVSDPPSPRRREGFAGGGGGEQLDDGVAAALAGRPLVRQAVGAGGRPVGPVGAVGAAQPGVQGGLAEGAEVEDGSEPAAPAGHPQVVAFGGLGVGFGALLVAVEGGRLGGVVA